LKIFIFFFSIKAQRYRPLLNRAIAQNSRNPGSLNIPAGTVGSQQGPGLQNTLLTSNNGQRNGLFRPFPAPIPHSTVQETPFRPNQYRETMRGNHGNYQPNQCGEILDFSLRSAQPRQLKSPNYPHGIQHLKSPCSWYINSPPGTRVKLNFSGFFLQTTSSKYCTDAYLEISDENSGTSFRLCKGLPGMLFILNLVLVD